MRLVYVVGEPGAGKSTLLVALSDGLVGFDIAGPCPWVEWRATHGAVVFAEPGKRRGPFSGTDALGMGVMPHACAWIAEHPADLVIGEGDRLASEGFFTAAEDAGYTVDIVLVDPGEDECRRRRAERGTMQNETWITGRRTKVRNIVQRRPPLVVIADSNPPDVAARSVLAAMK